MHIKFPMGETPLIFLVAAIEDKIKHSAAYENLVY